LCCLFIVIILYKARFFWSKTLFDLLCKFSWKGFSIEEEFCELLSQICEVPATICEVPATICEVPATICEVPATICEVPATICEVPATITRFEKKKLVFCRKTVQVTKILHVKFQEESIQQDPSTYMRREGPTDR